MQSRHKPTETEIPRQINASVLPPPISPLRMQRERAVFFFFSCGAGRKPFAEGGGLAFLQKLCKTLCRGGRVSFSTKALQSPLPRGDECTFSLFERKSTKKKQTSVPLDRCDRQSSRGKSFSSVSAVRFGKLHLCPKKVERNFDRRPDFVNLSVAWCVSELITQTRLSKQESDHRLRYSNFCLAVR